MNKAYKESRELGRSKKPPPPPKEEAKPLTEEDINKVEAEGRIYSEVGYTGDVDKMIVVQSDIYKEIEEAEFKTGMRVRTLFILNDGTLQMLMSGE